MVRYPLKNIVISWFSKNLFDGMTYTVRNGVNKGLRRRGGLGFRRDLVGAILTDRTAALLCYSFAGMDDQTLQFFAAHPSVASRQTPWRFSSVVATTSTRESVSSTQSTGSSWMRSPAR